MATTPTSLPPLLKVLRAGAGVVLFVAGVFMLVLPGPGLLFIALGLGLISPTLATRFKEIAIRLRDWLKNKIDRRRRLPPF
ncbi:MAG TPA: PGPGW domain-containing protein [Polyangiaceae bacterium]|jgi:hypothetical protein|nr:PGPGW domain-containing protein [Polyangiaceae bacterium]